jgi:hypothetical protein
MTPYHAHFGTEEATYFSMPKLSTDSEMTQEFVKKLDANLKILTAASNEYQQEIIAKRTASNNTATQNMYQPGDLVLYTKDSSMPRHSKLSPQSIGPYKTIEQVKNDVTARHLSSGAIQTLHVERLRRYIGTEQQAIEAAHVDNNQYMIELFLAYRGDPARRTTIQFEIRFQDGEIAWLPYSQDLFTTIHYEEFCRSRPELYPLIMSDECWRKECAILKKKPITIIKPGDEVFINIREIGAEFYDALDFPDIYHIQYLLKSKYTKFSCKDTRAELKFLLTGDRFTVSHEFVKLWGSKMTIDPVTASKVIDQEFISKFPSFMSYRNYI